jgi:hypothetical protein
MNKVLARFYWDCGRNGDVEGLFITTKADLKKLYGKNVYFGEILGKHSEVHGEVNECDIDILTEDQDFLVKLEAILGTTLSGYNPFDYFEPDEDDEEDEDEDPLCPVCNGTGEGQYDGSRCYSCKGSGVERREGD